jgi:hypothetical protein
MVNLPVNYYSVVNTWINLQIYKYLPIKLAILVIGRP